MINILGWKLYNIGLNDKTINIAALNNLAGRLF